MSLFSKQPTEPQKNPETEALKADVETLKASVAKDGEETQKQMAEICSALNILDADIAALKEEKSVSPTPPVELKEMRSAVESLTLIGRLCIQNKADLEVLTKKLDILEKKHERHEAASTKSPAKILN